MSGNGHFDSSTKMDAGLREEVGRLFGKKVNIDLAGKLVGLVDEFRDHWPMTLRAYYYQAVSHLWVSKNANEYRRIGWLMATLRREDVIPWECMEDKTRSTADKRGMPNVSEYIKNDLESFLHPDYYGRC